MAEEEKREEKKEESKTIWEIWFDIILAFIVFNGIVRAISGNIGGVNGTVAGSKVHQFLENVGFLRFITTIVIAYDVFANVLCILFIIGIAYTIIKLHGYEVEAQKDLYPSPEDQEEIPQKNTRWQAVLAHIGSVNPSDWRLAILECDIILDELLDKNGYIGDTIADKLKQGVRGDFTTLDSAWEAHRIRNAIAHEGQDFVLTQREALRVVNLYETVFREFDFI